MDSGYYTVKFDSLLLKEAVVEGDSILPPLRTEPAGSSDSDSSDLDDPSYAKGMAVAQAPGASNVRARDSLGSGHCRRLPLQGSCPAEPTTHSEGPCRRWGARSGAAPGICTCQSVHVGGRPEAGPQGRGLDPRAGLETGRSPSQKAAPCSLGAWRVEGGGESQEGDWLEGLVQVTPQGGPWGAPRSGDGGQD